MKTFIRSGTSPSTKELVMDNNLFSMGALIPLWILGAPLLGGIILMFTAPTPPSRSDYRDTRVS